MSGVFAWFSSFVNSLLTALGLVSKKGTILLLGLDNAGKTTLLHRLRTGSVQTFPPTDRPHLETFKVEEGGVTFAAWDLGGHEAVRHLWEDYAPDASAVMFLVDATDADRFDEVRDELDALVAEGTVEGAPLAVVLNKCDLPEARRSADVAAAIGYEELAMRHGEERAAVFRISVLRGEGYQDAFKWLASFL
eukprot:CAMPEP_0113561454 /NCGR_PEP_ID=MMETSP0015_2-20120614/19984_1 /TAXON_ID=2838 /ORGANISM="Odontella" /LENGTH=191 /DNA_ID=CAMNT_0000463249 /DNA_START=234 /DNA_END=812 /DNA_ORIENTATION=- /assembly_acc=CAM_ASM_000160